MIAVMYCCGTVILNDIVTWHEFLSRPASVLQQRFPLSSRGHASFVTAAVVHPLHAWVPFHPTCRCLCAAPERFFRASLCHEASYPPQTPSSRVSSIA